MTHFAVALRDFRLAIDDRTEIRLAHEADADEVFAVVGRNWQNLRYWLPHLAGPPTLDDTVDYLRDGERDMNEQSGFHALVVADGTVIGGLRLQPIDWENRWTLLSFFLDRAHRGRGLMTNAVRVVAEYAFEGLELNRIEVRTAVGDDRTAAVVQRLGFTDEGTLRQVLSTGGHFVDQRVFSILR
ncbi:MAG: GNAT family N-acetyltransferase, partial [Candidatus Eremiobacteraeota bacterium]|nr:GNAT family N-acetyltransferase [Candidatus Eremiobacteraeota bacterium]